jgi:putative addiction module component (TIGR02574 family)
MTLTAIQDSALQLSPNEKAALIDFLWDSLARKELVQLERRWAVEAEDRIDAFERGELAVEDGPEAIQKLRQSLRR